MWPLQGTSQPLWLQAHSTPLTSVAEIHFLVLVQARCQAPAKLVLQQPSLQPVQLESARSGSAPNIASVTVPIANQGNISLAVAFSLERRNASVLVPDQWLDPGSSYQQLFSGSQGSCSSGQVWCGVFSCTRCMPCILSQLGCSYQYDRTCCI